MNLRGNEKLRQLDASKNEIEPSFSFLYKNYINNRIKDLEENGNARKKNNKNISLFIHQLNAICFIYFYENIKILFLTL